MVLEKLLIPKGYKRIPTGQASEEAWQKGNVRIIRKIYKFPPKVIIHVSGTQRRSTRNLDGHYQEGKDDYQLQALWRELK